MNNVKIWSNLPIEEEALKQIDIISKLPIIEGHIAIMPDVHAGIGCTVGSVIPTKNAIVPSFIGVDIGCGVIAIKTNLTELDLPDDLYKFRLHVESKIPVGFNKHNNLLGLTLGEIYTKVLLCIKNFNNLELVKEHLPDTNINNIINQLGTLGGGNHFIELCIDENKNVWLMLHSGSRGIGNKIGTTAIELAKQNIKSKNINLEDTNTAWLDDGSKDFNNYIKAMLWAQDYASLNREIMMNIFFECLKEFVPHAKILNQVINCHHNFTSLENYLNQDLWITRKGAVRVRLNELGIIPSNMGNKSHIVRGLGNVDSYCSCSHGAGRLMSRIKAKRVFTVADLIEQTKGVECRKDIDVVDEIPNAYKPIDLVMEAQKDLVESIHTLKQVMCIKG